MPAEDWLMKSGNSSASKFHVGMYTEDTMLDKRAALLKILIVLLLLAPLLVDFWLSARDKHYSAVLQAQECDPDFCEGDFDGDGRLEQLVVDRTSPPASPYYDSWLVAVDDNRELFRLPRRYMDNTARTHVAVDSGSGKARLVVYDGGNRDAPVRAVFTWNGSKLVEESPSEDDLTVLAAMSARDDAGTFNTWVLYRVARTPALVCYYLIVVAFVVWRHRSTRSALK